MIFLTGCARISASSCMIRRSKFREAHLRKATENETRGDYLEALKHYKILCMALEDWSRLIYCSNLQCSPKALPLGMAIFFAQAAGKHADMLSLNLCQYPAGGPVGGASLGTRAVQAALALVRIGSLKNRASSHYLRSDRCRHQTRPSQLRRV